MRTVAGVYARVDVAMIPLPQNVVDDESGSGVQSDDPLQYYFPLINEVGQSPLATDQ